MGVFFFFLFFSLFWVCSPGHSNGSRNCLESVSSHAEGAGKYFGLIIKSTHKETG